MNTKTSNENLKKRFSELSEPLHCIPTGEKPKLKKLDGIKAVILDFYGTLFISGVGDIGIDDGKADVGMLLEALKSAGVSVSNEKAGLRGYDIYGKVVVDETRRLKDMGIIYPEPDIRKVWRNVLNQMLAEELIESPTSGDHHERMSVEFEARMNPIWPMPDLDKTLEGIRKKKLSLGIISNSQFYTPIAFEALAGKSLEEYGFEPELLHWSFEEQMKKPSELFYERFMRKAKSFSSGIKAGEILYVGNDMLKDVYPAAKLGMKTALFAGDKRSLKWRRDDNRCKDLEPDLVITELVQLLECL